MDKFYDEIKEIFCSHEMGIKYAKFSFFLFLAALCYNTFIIPIDLVAGGSSGIGVLLKSVFDIDPSITLFIISFIMFVLAYLFLDAKQVVASLFIALVYPLFIKATSGVADILLIDEGHVLVIVLFSAIINGFCQGSMFKLGFNIGGLSVVSLIIHKYSKTSVTLVNSFINAIVVVIGGFTIGFSMILYALLFLIINRTVSEKVILGVSKNKTFKIISKNYVLIEEFIHNTLGHDVTLYDTYDASKTLDRKLIMTVVPSSEFTILRDYVKSVDKKAFIFVADTYESLGQDIMISHGNVK